MLDLKKIPRVSHRLRILLAPCEPLDWKKVTRNHDEECQAWKGCRHHLGRMWRDSGQRQFGDIAGHLSASVGYRAVRRQSQQAESGLGRQPPDLCTSPFPDGDGACTSQRLPKVGGNKASCRCGHGDRLLTTRWQRSFVWGATLCPYLDGSPHRHASGRTVCPILSSLGHPNYYSTPQARRNCHLHWSVSGLAERACG